MNDQERQSGRRGRPGNSSSGSVFRPAHPGPRARAERPAGRRRGPDADGRRRDGIGPHDAGLGDTGQRRRTSLGDQRVFDTAGADQRRPRHLRLRSCLQAPRRLLHRVPQERTADLLGQGSRVNELLCTGADLAEVAVPAVTFEVVGTTHELVDAPLPTPRGGRRGSPAS